jgi:hypothetical protein
MNDDGIDVLTTFDSDYLIERNHVGRVGFFRIICEIPSQLLKPQGYTITVGAGELNIKVFDRHLDIVQFEIVDMGSMSSMQGNKRSGVISPILPWKVLGPFANLLEES